MQNNQSKYIQDHINYSMELLHEIATLNPDPGNWKSSTSPEWMLYYGNTHLGKREMGWEIDEKNAYLKHISSNVVIWWRNHFSLHYWNLDRETGRNLAILFLFTKILMYWQCRAKKNTIVKVNMCTVYNLGLPHQDSSLAEYQTEEKKGLYS